MTGAPAEHEPPVYRTRIPPAATLVYATRHGMRRGVATLSWQPDAERYAARLDTRLPGTADRVQISQGTFDESGVAPHRFTDQRARGGTLAANFQREAGRITFSGPSVNHPLWMGSQDRLSWLFQLAAVVAGEPQRQEPGGKVVIHVVDARGDSRLWIFRFVGLETLTANSGAVPVARYVRVPDEPYDTRVEVWLDPRRNHLPARALFHSGQQDDGVEWLLQDADSRP